MEESGQFSKLGSLFGSFFVRVAYYIGDLERDPNLENYPSVCELWKKSLVSRGSSCTSRRPRPCILSPVELGPNIKVMRVP